VAEFQRATDNGNNT